MLRILVVDVVIIMFVCYLSPQCSLVVTLMHSYDGVEQLGSGLLHPSMPLTHFRAFFCEWVSDMLLHSCHSFQEQHLFQLIKQPLYPILHAF